MLDFDSLRSDMAPVADCQHKTQMVPIACYGLMGVEINAIKDWYKLSPHFLPCRDIRAGMQIKSEVEV